MAERITVKDLRAVVARINRVVGRPEGEPDWTREDPCLLCGGSDEPPMLGWLKTPAGKGAGHGIRDAFRWDPTHCPRCHGQGRRLTASIGRYVLSAAYGGWELQRLESEGGGVDDVLGSGHVPARELYGLLHAWLRGFEAAEDLTGSGGAS